MPKGGPRPPPLYPCTTAATCNRTYVRQQWLHWLHKECRNCQMFARNLIIQSSADRVVYLRRHCCTHALVRTLSARCHHRQNKASTHTVVLMAHSSCVSIETFNTVRRMPSTITTSHLMSALNLAYRPHHGHRLQPVCLISEVGTLQSSAPLQQ